MAGFGTEINTFSPIPTGMSLFEEVGIFRGDASLRWQESGGENYIAPILEVWRNLAEEHGDELHEGLCACAQPAGVIPRPVYESIRDELLADVSLREADVVLLCLHGAMVAEAYEDCEGDLLARVRQLTGDEVTIGVHLDLHVNLTETMLENADILVSHKQYPHTDGAARAVEIYHLCTRAAAGEINPVTRLFDVRMMGLFPTTQEPLRSFVDDMSALETGPVLSVSLGHGFPWSDVSSAGAKVWVTTDNDEELAIVTAKRLGQKFYGLRDELMPEFHTVGSALDLIREGSVKKPVVIADVSDNAGGGSPSDSTFVLRGLLDKNMANAALGCFWDPESLQRCLAAGNGGTTDIQLGGKHGAVSGTPVRLSVTVRAIREDHEQVSYEELVYPLGTSVWAETDSGIHIVLTSVRSQTYSPDAFTGLGLSLQGLDIIVVKSSQHFYAKFHEMAGDILYVETPGTMPMDFSGVRYRKRQRDFFPCMPDPLPESFIDE